jgi:hypothetical protein
MAINPGDRTMNDKKQNNFLPPHEGMTADNRSTTIYDDKSLPEWLQQPVAEQQWAVDISPQKEEQAAIPDWVLKPVNF